MHQRHTFLGRGEGKGGSGVRDMASPLLGNFGAKFPQTSFPQLRPILCKSAIVILREQKTIDSNNYCVFNVLFAKCVAHKTKSCAYFSAFPYTSISRKVVGQNVHATILKGIMGYDQ